ncbi:hypothetical protein [Magnetospirillum moscoviense]|uniref:Uncharacterized protein n=1 Tax=Magnetospirillum moscoviense TaxID=1437059 RepID=A0A178MDI6_9PROT|nr:hypothetical protein [Magnetospirillum moscoviense]OAN46880.1 hypothetical protein A6A05_16080 [Magnetospirillum moscoviense]
MLTTAPIRHDLNPLDRAVFLHQRKEIYERLHPETKHGAQGGVGGQRNENDTMSFSKDTAEKCGWTARTIDRAVAIAKGIQPDVRARLVGTALSRNQAELLKLVKLSNGQQHTALNLLLAVPPQGKNVEEARRIITGARAAAPAGDDGFAALLSKWTRATPRERSAFLDHLWNHKTDDTLREFVAGLNQEEAA